jgi:hypothetical protein
VCLSVGVLFCRAFIDEGTAMFPLLLKRLRPLNWLFRTTYRIIRSLVQGSIRWLIRRLLSGGKKRSRKRSRLQSGFVLPTTMLLLLVVTLTIGAISYRTYTQSQRTIGQRQQAVIYNAATPAIDRAKAKLEFMFNPNRDRRFVGTPTEDQLLSMMLNDGQVVERFAQTGVDPYVFPDETRLDINGDRKKDNAWLYEIDRDGDGTNDSRIIYSIIFDAPDPQESDPALSLKDSTSGALAKRARRLLIRNAPLSGNDSTRPSCARNYGSASSRVQEPTKGWFADRSDTTVERKNFQVNVYVVPINAPGGAAASNNAVATLEFQQDRQINQGFRWAAWFRNDLEIFPGASFYWNGAMHTEGSYFVGDGNFKSYLVSSPFSCLYRKGASQMTGPDIRDNLDDTIPDFQGQFVAGTIRDNTFSGGSTFDIFRTEHAPPDPRNRPLESSTDSVSDHSSGPIALALDPLKLHTEDISVGRIVADPRSNRRSDWETTDLGKRMSNLSVPPPYVDDTFRADNRYGPRPRYGEQRELIPEAIGTTISGNDKLTNENTGLDGYWERQARKEGLRIIVGQRLELGDPAGWGGPAIDRKSVPSALDDEPLRPWTKECTGSDKRCNEARQRKTLWDNLAAVQATAIYHSAENRDYPAACLATTVHPGTMGTLEKSATFEDLAFGIKDGFAAPYNQSGRVISDFFRGRGTNGWQFSMPSASTFPSSTMIKALRNLAYYAGDPLGGAPSFQVEQSRQNKDPHPFPPMAMWGDFSMLRRILDSGISYANLSPADKTTLHTAACMMGMLAYNLDYLNKFDVDYDNPPSSLKPVFDNLKNDIRDIDTAIYNGIGGSPPLDKIGELSQDDMSLMVWLGSGSGSSSDKPRSNDPETYVRLLEFWRDSASNNGLKERLTKEINLARMIITKEQVERDRKWGFAGSYPPDPGSPKIVDKFSETCASWYDNQSDASYFQAAASDEPLMRLCSNWPRYPILFSLFPQDRQHGDVSDSKEDFEGPRSVVPRGVVFSKVRDFQDNKGKIRNYLDRNDVNGKITYELLSADEIAQLSAEPLKLGDLGGDISWTLPAESAGNGATPTHKVEDGKIYNLIKICPAGTWDAIACSRAKGSSPMGSSPMDSTPVSGALYRVPFKDSAFYNPREMMSVRALNLDLDLLRRNPAFTSADYWLPKSGVIYAYREDAVSEAHIVRPHRSNWETCRASGVPFSTGGCQMDTGKEALISVDPPISPLGITPKPVDFFPDPDRRPYGFRLRNGAALWRGNTLAADIASGAKGLSFITDNPLYIQGHFNLHRAADETSVARTRGLEEFKEKLNTADFESTGSADGESLHRFYDRKTLDARFADYPQDQWRLAEVLTDALTPLSPNFCDGSIEDALISSAPVDNNRLKPDDLQKRYGCPAEGANSKTTSYMSLNRPTVAVPAINEVKWVRASLVDTYWKAAIGSGAPSDTGSSPIVFSANGVPLVLETKGSAISGIGPYEKGDSGSYMETNADRPLIEASSGMQMNLVMISGIVPSRLGQSYGGLHNFPRFIENWQNKEFFLSGAMVQLNFSTYATAPYDQEQMEPSQPDPKSGTGSNEWIAYYKAPLRRWGFDVGLKYVEPGPVSRRFKSTELTRSEFYSEPATDDPYTQLLAACANRPNNC